MEQINEELIKKIKDKKNQENFKKLLESLIEKELSSLNYVMVKKLNTISEYDFSIIKLEGKTKKAKEEIEFFIKVIPKDKIKESIFCYWNLIYDDELERKNLSKNKDFMLKNKVSISEKEINKNKNTIFLKIENNKLELLKNGTKIHFLNIEKYIEKFPKIHKEKEELLFIGIVEKN